MSIPNPTLARVAGTVAALVLIAIATIGVFAGLNGADEAVAGPAEVTAALAPRAAVAPVAPVATVEIGPDRTGPSLDPFTGEVILAAYTELTPAEWADGVFAGFAPEPTPAPVAPPAASVALAPAAPPAAVETPAVVESSATQSAAASTESTSVQAAPFDGPIVAESVGPAPTPAPTEPAIQNDGWAALRNCESGGNYQTNTGNGFYGAYQFTISTWNAVAQIIDPAYVGVRPDQAPPAIQDRMASALRHEIAWGGWQHWPVCGQFIA
jgi:hypothetical protein